MAIEYVVKGHVRNKDGTAVTRPTVLLFDRDLRSEMPLGSARSNDEGFFEVSYSAERFEWAEARKGAADLSFQVLDHEQEPFETFSVFRILAEERALIEDPPIIFNAGPEEVVDLVIGGGDHLGPSEYELLLEELKPVLHGMSPADLTENDEHQDVTFLSKELRVDPEQIVFLIVAHRMARETDFRLARESDLSPEVFYGFFRQNLPTNLPALLSQSSEVQRRALEAAISENLIPARFGEEIEEILERLKQLSVKQAFKAPSQDGKTSLAALLGTTLEDEGQQEAFLTAYVDHTGSTEEFWKGMRENPEFADRVDDLRFTLQLGALTANHLPLVKELQRDPETTTLRDLTRFDEAGWQEIITREGVGFPPDAPGEDETEKTRNYARAMTHMVEDASPTAFIARRLENEEIDGKEGLLTFFENNENFDITTTRLESYLTENPDALNGVVDKATVKRQIKTMQRLYKKVTSHYAQMRALMGDGLDSARSITHLGPTAFTLEYDEALGGEAEARRVYENAEQVAAMATALLAENGMASKKTPTEAVPDTVPEQVEGIPDWPTLFGSLDLCECEHCRSVYSPAAYLVDALHFLEERLLVENITRDDNGRITGVSYKKKPGTTDNMSAKHVLFERRPDLGEIELTCENTNTPVPYVDLINEVLENFVAPFDPPFTPFALDAALENDLNARTLSTDLRNAFTPPLSEHAVVSIEKKGERWAIEDLSFTYTIRKEGGQLRVTARGLQTSGTPEERAANPQYVNPNAYTKLRQQVFPWQLPFDLWLEETRAYLGHLGVQRHEAMETVLLDNRAALLASADVAREHLGLSSEEANLIAGVTTSQPEAASPGVWNLWGFGAETLDSTNNAIPDPADSTKWITSGNWLDVLTQRVDVFLHQSGLRYKDLLDLLTTTVINPVAGNDGHTITIRSTHEDAQDSCVLSELELVGLDEESAGLISRFVRLWRKLGWSIQNLDRAFTALHPSGLNNSFLTQLSHVKRLHDELGVPVERLLSFWAPIDTAVYTDPHADGQPELPSLYARLFRNKTAANPLDPDFTEDPADLTGTLSDRVATITAALGISAADFSLLFNDKNVIPRDTADPSKPDDKLTLDHLSRLHRHATLARALKLPVRDYLSALKLGVGDPFATTADTVLFVERIGRMRASGFRVAELDYLLRHEFVASTRVAPTDQEIALVLSDIRAGLQTIASENTFSDDPADPNGVTTDPNGELTGQKLALLNWDSRLIEQVIATLNDAVTYRAHLPALPALQVTLDALPAGFVFPDEVKSVVTYDATSQRLKASRLLSTPERAILLNASADPDYRSAVQALFELQDELQGEISYDPDEQELIFAGAMTRARRAKLKSISSDTDYQNAVDELFKAPRTFVARNMRTFSVPNFSKPLAAFPATVGRFPSALKDRVYYDATTKELHFIGAMTEAERDVLLALSSATDPNHARYRAAVKALFRAPNSLTPQQGNRFLRTSGSNNEAAVLFDNSTTPAARFALVLKKLMPYLRTTLSERLVTQKLGEVFKLETKTTEELLKKWVHSPTDPTQKTITEFLASSFVESHPNVALSRSAFGRQFATFTLLHKIALVVSRLEMRPEQLRWVFEYGPNVGWLDLNTLPLVAASPSSTTWQDWERLLDLLRLRDALPKGEALLNDLFSTAHEVSPTATDARKNAAKEKCVETLSVTTTWSEVDLEVLVGEKSDHTKTGLLNATFPDAFKDERLILRLHDCFAALKRLGISAEQCRELADPIVMADPEDAEKVARSVKQAVRAKYDEAQWLKLAKPLRDGLREKQRSALVAYLLTHPDRSKGHEWRDTNDVYAHFLIDVEMSPCQMTSRIKQAISSAQLFVQRCLMNLEKEVVANAEVDERWREWKWMKNYRVWEANRKVFLYPENWIEPELRDDKSPFFKELENELLQNDLTMETAETAFVRYLEKLDQVARLEIVGMYHQVETRDGTSSGDKLVDVLHVFGRTRGEPHTYYYRRRIDSAHWTAWEKVDVDIEGDHLIPVVWNRRLYLLWLMFTEKQEEKGLIMPGAGGEVVKGAQYWEIRLAWSEYTSGKWAAKRISSSRISSIEFITDPFRPQEAFTCKAFEVNENLTVRLYSYAQGSYHWPFAEFRFTGCNSTPSVPPLRPFGRKGPNTPAPVIHPTGTSMKGMMLVESSDRPRWAGKLVLFTGSFPSTGEPEPVFDSAKEDIPTFNKTPGTFFRLLPPHQDPQFASGRPFFFQDDTKTFFVIPEDVRRLGGVRPEITDVDMRSLALLSRHYFDAQKPILTPDGLTPFAHPDDPLIFEPSFPVRSEFTATGDDMPPSAVVPWGAVQPMFARADEGLLPHTFSAENLASLLKPEAVGTVLLPVFRPPKRYLFHAFYHPYVCTFVLHLNRDGVDGLLQRPLQLVSREFFVHDYEPDKVSRQVVRTPYPKEDVDFAYDGAYSQYNWELFFHVPLLIADRLSKNQRFEEAQRWFHYVFDPTDTSGLDVPKRYWRTRPFYETTDEQYQKEKITNLLRSLANRSQFDELSEELKQELEELEDKVREWRKNPFKPHLVARTRTTAYQKTVVMKYIDNLIAWGDQLFRRDTIESINEATQLYILAAELLGKRPEEIPPRAVPEVQTYNSLEPQLDEFSDALVQIEEFVPPSSGTGTLPTSTPPSVTLPTMLYFCVPKNDKLLGYWDTVADRLFKIRHCMNIEGVVRQLPLFEPPIDPALLVRATAAGVDISSALSDINTELPHYRFNVVAQKASELCAELKSLGGALLSALEKRDAEELALLRSTHEIRVLNALRQVKEKQVDEAVEALEGLKQSRQLAEMRLEYYASIAFMNAGERAHLNLTETGLTLQSVQAMVEYLGNVLSLVPDVKVGSLPTTGATSGGSNLGGALKAMSGYMGSLISQINTTASMSATLGGYRRRADEWDLQKRLAAKEIEQIDKQIAAAEIREAIAEQDLKNHDLQVENAKESDAFMRDKFTNRELYDWMVGQISGVYFQSYQLTYDVAKRAERAYRHELGLKDSNFVRFGYWDSLKKGLLAGERLYHDLKRMEVAYLDQNRREYEIVKHVSLAQLDPLALVRLKQTGECFINVPEALFDLDYAGHYMRRINSFGVTIPGVTPPFTGVKSKFTLTKSSIRHTNVLNGSYAREENDSRFTDSVGAIQSIVTSSGQNDSGLFEPSMRDERYLPFEGAGVISEWRIELPKEFRQFDYDTISDVVLHIRYTAREGGSLLNQQAISELQNAINEIVTAEGDTGFARLFSARHEFPSEWHRFLHSPGDQTLTLPLKDRFPYLFHGRTIEVKRVDLLVQLSEEFIGADSRDTVFILRHPNGDLAEFELPSGPNLGNILHTAQSDSSGPEEWTLVEEWTLEVQMVSSALALGDNSERLNPAAVEDIGVVVHYTVA